MNGLSIHVDISGAEGIQDDLKILADGLSDRTQLHEAMAKEGAALTRDHLIRIANERHDTAEELGASPSGFWGYAAEQTTSEATNEAGVVTITHPGIGRAIHDRDIVPKEKEWLTIALIAQAYNQRAYRIEGLFFVQPSGKDYALLGKRLGKGKEAVVTWWYLLVRSIHQDQDRTLLPSDEEYRIAALQGVRNYIDYLLFRGERA